MPLRRRGNGDDTFVFPHQMTAAERTALKNANMPGSILDKLQDGGKAIQVTTLAFKKVAAQMRAEAEAYEESLRAELAKEAYARRMDLEKEIDVLRKENHALERDNKRLHTQLGRATARPALAESGEGTR